MGDIYDDANNPFAVANLNGASFYDYGASVADDGTFNLPVIPNAGRGTVVVGADEEAADFTIKSDGTVSLISASANVVANADTDAKFCIGTSVASPCVIKNRLGAAKNAVMHLVYG